MNKERETIPDYVKKIMDEAVALRGTQPFYDGQMGFKLVTTNNTYDYYFTMGDYDENRLANYEVIFTADNQSPPFCEVYPVIVDSNGNPVQSNIANSREATDISTNWSIGKEVHRNYYTGVDFDYVNTRFHVKVYVIASDTGSIQVRSR